MWRVVVSHVEFPLMHKNSTLYVAGCCIMLHLSELREWVCPTMILLIAGQRSSKLLLPRDEREHFLCALEEEHNEKVAQTEHNEA